MYPTRCINSKHTGAKQITMPNGSFNIKLRATEISDLDLLFGN
jgi:hypothetical protein